MKVENIDIRLTLADNNTTVSAENILMGADITDNINEVSSANIKLKDKDGTLFDDLELTSSFGMLIEYKIDDGNWKRLFRGGVDRCTYEINDTGERTATLYAYGGTSLRYNYLSPNQVGIGNYQSISTIFVGTPTASDGTSWSYDENENYPNGLLYDTGLRFNSDVTREFITDIFPDKIDVPVVMGLGRNKKLESIANLLSPYGINYIIDERARRPFLALMKSPRTDQFPIYTGTDFAIGKNIGNMSRDYALTAENDTVTVVGKASGIVGMYGNAIGKEQREKFYKEDDVATFADALELAKQRVLLNDSVQESIKLQTTAKNVLDIYPSLIGKSVIVRERGVEETYSVIGMKHSISPVKWTVDLVCENPEIDAGKTYGEIIEQIQNQKNEDIKDRVYINCYGEPSLWSGYMSLSHLHTYSNVCAMGIGKDSTNNDYVTFSDPEYKTQSIEGNGCIISPLLIIPTVASYSVDTGITSYLCNFGNIGNALVKEIVLLANDKTVIDNLPYSNTWSFDYTKRPTVETASDWLINQGDGVDLRNLLYYNDHFGAFPIKKTLITKESDDSERIFYSYKPNSGCEAKIISTSNEIISYLDETGQISSSWADAECLTKDVLNNISQDSSFALTGSRFDYKTQRLSIASTDAHGIQEIFTWNTPAAFDEMKKRLAFLKLLKHNLQIKATFSGDTTLGTVGKIRSYLWMPAATPYWYEILTDYGNIGAVTPGEINLFDDSIPTGYVQANGDITFMLFVSNSMNAGTSSDTTGSIEISLGYLDCMAEIKPGQTNITSVGGGKSTIFEKLGFNRHNAIFRPTYAPTKIVHCYMDADYDATTGAWSIKAGEQDYMDVIDKIGVIMTPDPKNKLIHFEYNPKRIPTDKNENLSQWDYYWKHGWDGIGKYTIGNGEGEPIYEDVPADKLVNYLNSTIYSYMSDEAMETWIENPLFFVYETDDIPNFAENNMLDINTLVMIPYSTVNGEVSSVYINKAYAPAYGCKINLGYDAVGMKDLSQPADSGIVISRCVVGTTSGPVREGIDMNTYKNLTVQFDFHDGATNVFDPPPIPVPGMTSSAGPIWAGKAGERTATYLNL